MYLTVRHIFSIIPLLVTSILLRDQSSLDVVFLLSSKIRSYGLLLLYNSQLDSIKNYSEHHSSYVKRMDVVLDNEGVILFFSFETDNNNLEKRSFQFRYNEQTSNEGFTDTVLSPHGFRIGDLSVSSILIAVTLPLGIILCN
ncbi:hypothetical protein MNBD_IGNAVI01-1574 [hydrothermal vent metagenome]|uniref:Uncharacterized protein n=1 Tax=hydrothermal vent metagenome TaxID=652676 RepID=A0A3B1CRA4_9ZZZZ